MSTHHSYSRAHGLWREVLAKLCSYDSTVSMGTGYLPPNHPVLAGLLIPPLLGLLVYPIHVRYPLATVVCCLFSIAYPIQLQEGCIRVLVAPATLVPNKYTLIVQPKNLKVTYSPSFYGRTNRVPVIFY